MKVILYCLTTELPTPVNLTIVDSSEKIREKMQQYYYSLLCCSCSNARQSWSGQEVGLSPQRMPLSFLITSSAFCPFTKRQTACRLPPQPPIKEISCITSCSSTVTSINCEQVPWVL